MRSWTVHAAANRATVPTTIAADVRLVPEGFCWAGLLLGPLWLLAQGSWLAGSALLLAGGALAFLLPDLAPSVLFALHAIAGLLAHDLRRVALQRRGLPVAGVIVAAHRDDAILRLWRIRPDLARGLAS
jgi:hypothetical protein